MTTRNNLGDHTIAVFTALEQLGPANARKVTEATGLPYNSVHQALRRWALRGLIVVDRDHRYPTYAVKPTWRERLEPKPRPGKTRPTTETTVARAIASAPALHTIWSNRAA